MQVAIDRLEAEPLPSTATRKDLDLFAWVSAADQQQAREIADGYRAAKREQLELEKKARDIKFRISKAAQLEQEAETRRVQMALGELPEGVDIPIVESSSRIDRMALAKLDEKLEEAKANEKEFLAKSHAHYLASYRRAAIALYRERFEVAALELKQARFLLLAAQQNAAAAGAANILHEVTFRQMVIPCEPGLSAVQRKYVQGNMCDWFVFTGNDDSAHISSIALKAQADWMALVGEDVPFRWTR